MDQIANPYRPGAGTPPPALIGRDDLIDRFGVTLRRTLSGRPGKRFPSDWPVRRRQDSPVESLISIASAEGVKTAFIESPESGDFASLLAIRLRRILLEMSTGALKPAVSKAWVRCVRSPCNGSPRSPITVEDVNSVARAGVVATLDGNFFRVRLKPPDRKKKESCR